MGDADGVMDVILLLVIWEKLRITIHTEVITAVFLILQIFEDIEIDPKLKHNQDVSLCVVDM